MMLCFCRSRWKRLVKSSGLCIVFCACPAFFGLSSWAATGMCTTYCRTCCGRGCQFNTRMSGILKNKSEYSIFAQNLAHSVLYNRCKLYHYDFVKPGYGWHWPWCMTFLWHDNFWINKAPELSHSWKELILYILSIWGPDWAYTH